MGAGDGNVTALMKPGEVMGRLGISRRKLADLVAVHALERVRFKGRNGRWVGYSWFRREEVERIADPRGNGEADGNAVNAEGGSR